MTGFLDALCPADGCCLFGQCEGGAGYDWPSRLMEVEGRQIMWFVLCLALFTLLAKLSPAVRGQRIRRAEWGTDIAYWFVMPLLYLPLSLVITTLLLHWTTGGNHELVRAILGVGKAPYNEWPLAAQFGAVLLLTDVMQYIIHRWFHSRMMWRWHAIHHSPTQLDWLTSARFHPVNMLFSVLLTGAVITAIGFDPEVFGYLTIFNVLYSGMVHANLNWTFGPLRYVLASPVFHRWHHTSPEFGGDQNFAPTFAFLDLLFGSFYMPRDDRPDAHEFGVMEAVPKGSFFGQLVWPFTGKVTSFEEDDSAAA